MNNLNAEERATVDKILEGAQKAKGKRHLSSEEREAVEAIVEGGTRKLEGGK